MAIPSVGLAPMSKRCMPNTVVLTVISCLMLSCEGDRTGGHAVTALANSMAARAPNEANPTWRGENGWLLSTAALVEIRSGDSPQSEAPFGVVGAARLRDGGVVVGTRGTNELLYFNSDGRLVEAAGGHGRGPGEFEHMLWVQPLHDTIVAYDFSTYRFHYFSQTGAHIRSISMASMGGMVIPVGVGVFEDGTVLVQTFMRQNREPGVRSTPVPYYRYFPNTDTFKSLGTYRGKQTYGIELPGRGFVWLPVLFGRTTVLAVRGDRYLLGWTGRYSIGVHSKDGVLESTIRKALDPVAVTDEHVAVLRGRMTEMPETHRLSRAFREATEQMPVPSTMPAFGVISAGPSTQPSLLVDDLGDVWVLDVSSPSSGTAQWSVFNASGTHVETLRLPAELELLHIGADFAVARVKDPSGVEYVRVHALCR